MTLEIVIQDFEAAIANGGYGGTRFLSSESELLLLSAYNYVFNASWVNKDGYSPLTPEQNESIRLWTARAQDELMSKTRVGEIIWSMVNPTNAPDNYLLCDGSTFTATQYPDLADALGSEWADPFLPDTWNTPNLINAYASGRAAGDMKTRVSANSVTLTTGQMPTHSHSYTRPFVQAVTYTPGPGPATFVTTFNSATTSAGGGNSHENRPLTQYLYPYVISS